MNGNDPIGTRKLKVVQIIDETPDTKSFVFQDTGNDLAYKAGQFLTFIFKNRHGKEVRRSYSISSSPDLNEPLTITVKRVPNGEISRMLFEKIKPGDHLTTIGASGFFVLPENISELKQVVFVAAGSGVAPVFALIKSILHVHPAISVLLIYSNRNLKNTIFHKQLHDLHRKFSSQLSIEYLFSTSHDLSRSRLTPEILSTLLQAHKIKSALYYVCGPYGYMRMVSISLQSLGVLPLHIKKEIFFVQHPAVTPAPPDTASHAVQLLAHLREYHFTVQYPVTILQAAKLLHIPIPYSCENGQCGTCVATCLRGSVWMARNEVLLDEEIERGKILTCTGYPIYGDVTLQL